jgi:hypothetical protein
MEIEWRLEGYKGWCIEYPITTLPDGTKYTPLDEWIWREHYNQSQQTAQEHPTIAD